MSAVDLCRVRPDAREWFTFAFVRHPFQRALSIWYDLHVSRTDRQHDLQKRADLFDRFYGLADAREFDAYCEWLNTPYGADKHADPHFMSMEPQIRLGNGRLPDFVGRFESIEADWCSVVARLGMPVLELPFVHSGLGWNATAEDVLAMRSARARLLTARNKELLSVRYAGDLELWRSSGSRRAAGSRRAGAAGRGPRSRWGTDRRPATFGGGGRWWKGPLRWLQCVRAGKETSVRPMNRAG